MTIQEQKASILRELQTIEVPIFDKERELVCQQFRMKHYALLPVSEHGWLNVTVSDYFGV